MAEEELDVDRLLDQLIKGKTPEEIVGETGILKDLTRRLVERALEGEMSAHLGYEKHAAEGRNGGNSRNGRTRKRVKTGTAEVEVEVPRDREGSFEPQLVRKRRRRLPGFDNKVLALYARGMTTREIQGHLKELYEGAKFWLSILSELKNRGVEDILIAAVDGLKGFPEAIETVYPKTQIQLCVVHMIRNSLRCVSWKERRAAAKDLRTIYTAPTVEAAEAALDTFARTWDARYPVVSRQWRSNWARLTPFFDYPPAIRKVIYTTNAVESINAQLRKLTRKRSAFPTPESVRKVLYLAMLNISQRWTRSVKDWPAALSHLCIVFPGRLPTGAG